MSHEAKKTKDHNEIRAWAEERGGKPATVTGTDEPEEPGLLRIEFPGQGSEEQLQEVSWDDFFHKFDESNLTFLCQEETEDGHTSRFNKFVRE